MKLILSSSIDQTTWQPTDLHLSVIGPAIKDKEALELMVANPAKFKEIQEREIDIVSDTDEVVQNEQGELALISQGTYYPTQKGKWIIPEPVTYENEDGKEETRYENLEYNYCIIFEGIRFLLIIE